MSVRLFVSATPTAAAAPATIMVVRAPDMNLW
jgi:hypothetical protein